MDWRCIGTSFQGDPNPSNESSDKKGKECQSTNKNDNNLSSSHKRRIEPQDSNLLDDFTRLSGALVDVEAPEYSFGVQRHKIQRRQATTLEYSRLPCVIGVSQQFQHLILEQLDEDLKSHVQVAEKKLNRYYKCMNKPLDSTDTLQHVNEELIKRRTQLFQSVFTSDGPCRNLNLWLQYIRAKADEYIASSALQCHELPQWLLPPLSQENERRLMLQSLDIWCRASQPLYQGNLVQDFEWNDADGKCANAYYFCVALYLKLIANSNFDVLIDTCKWLKTWSNDYLSLEDVSFMIPASIHLRVAQEPLFWQFISSILLKANLPIKRFYKIYSAYYKHLMSAGIDSTRVQESLVVLTCECLIPKLLQVGEDTLTVNIVASWLSRNLYQEFCSAYVGRLGGTECLYMQMQTRSNASVTNGQVLMKLAAQVEDWILKHSSHDQRLCNVEAASVEWEPIVLCDEILQELMYRILDIFGGDASLHCSSNSRWYNISIGLNFKSENFVACKLFRALILLHILVSKPTDVTWALLLADCCDLLDIYEPLCSLFMDSSLVWANFVSRVAQVDLERAICILHESLKTWPQSVTLLATCIHFYTRPDSNERIQVCIDDFMRKFMQTLQLEAVTVATVVAFLQEPSTTRFLPGIVTNGYILALIYIWNNRSALNNASMFNNVVEIVTSMHPTLVPHFMDRLQLYMHSATLKLVLKILQVHGNHLQVVVYSLNLLFGKFPTSVYSTLRNWLSRDIVHEQFASRALELHCRYTATSNFDSSPVKRAIIAKWLGIPLQSLVASSNAYPFSI